MNRTALNFPPAGSTGDDLRLFFAAILRRSGFGQFLTLLRAAAEHPGVGELGDGLVAHLRSNGALGENETMTGASTAADAPRLLALTVAALRYLETLTPASEGNPASGGANG